MRWEVTGTDMGDVEVSQEARRAAVGIDEIEKGLDRIEEFVAALR